MIKFLLPLLLLSSSAYAEYFNKLLINQTNPAGSYLSGIMDITRYAEYSIQIIATGTVTCNASINVGNDNDNSIMILLSGSSSAVTNTGLIYTIKGGYRYVQLSLAACAGAGNIKAYFVAKDI